MMRLTGGSMLLLGLMMVESAFGGAGTDRPGAAPASWRAGTARVEITPREPMWMAGYGARRHPSEGVLHPLQAKALALEDAAGRRAVLVTSDLLGFPKGVSDRIRDRLEAAHGLGRDQVMLTSSHTHTGPVLQEALQDIYPLDDAEREKVARYSHWLEDRIVEVVAEALGRLAPARVSRGVGVTRFAVNRRNNRPAGVMTATELAGPSDHTVPVLKVEAAGGELLAVAFGYACHATALPGSFYRWTGGWPAMAQEALEAAHPGATALFFAGAGADQDPIPRGTLPLARQYGREMAAAVDRVLQEEMQEVAPHLRTSYGEVTLPLTDAPSREALGKMAEEATGSQQRWARRLLGLLERGEALRQDYPYPVQIWRLGEQTLVALGGEVVVDYAIRLKRLLGHDLFVAAYANDVMGYIPSTRVLREGGYEGASAQIVYGLPGTWTADVEERIIGEVLRQAAVLQVALPRSPLE